MDKMYNNLMDIVNRTKTIGGSKTTVKKVVPKKEVSPEDAPIDEAVDTVRKTTTKKSLISEGSAIGKLLNATKAKKEVVKKKEDPIKKSTKTTPKKATSKSTTKSTAKKTTKETSPTKKASNKTPITPKKEIVKKPTPTKEVKKEAPKLDLNDPKNVELYNALKTSLFSEGTDISAYMEEEKPKEESRNILKALQAKKEANKETARLNSEISREQQEYEELFTGGLGYENTEEVVEDKEEIARLQEYLRPKTESHREREVTRVDMPKISSEAEEKIADYYKRKNEKIAEYLKEEKEEEVEEEKTDAYEDRQREYEDIFATPYTPIQAEDTTPMEEDVPDNYDDSVVSSFELMENENAEDVAEESSEESETLEENIEEDNDDDDTEAPFLFLNRNKENVEEIETVEEEVSEVEEKEEDYSDYDDEELDRYPTVKNELIKVDDDVAGEETINAEDEEEIEELLPFEEEVIETASEVEENASENEEFVSEYEVEETESDDEEYTDEEEYAEVSPEEEDLIYVNKRDDEDEGYENELSKYIISDNLTDDKHISYDVEDNTIVLDNVNDVYEKEEKEEEIKEDTISKEEFYNEMARLQENLINELKGDKVETGVDLFEEKEEKPVETVEVKVEEVAPRELTPEEKAEAIVDRIIGSITKEEALQKIVDGVVEENHKYDEFNLLGKDAPLGEDDLEYIRKNKEKERDLKDKYFYLSAEDNEKKAEIEDAYMDMYNAEVSGNISRVEMGDINLNKDINNPQPYAYDYMEDETTEEASEEEMEAIYTLFGVEKKKVMKVEKEMKILYVASECQPFVATGGLADVAGSVSKAMAKEGNIDCRVIMPLYGVIKENYRNELEYIGNFTVHLSWRQEYCGLFRYYKDGVTYYFIDNERYFKREKTYGYYDDGERYAYFCKAIVESLPILNFFPDVIHCNDWQSALVSVYIKTGNWADHRYYRIKHIYTIHNIEYQGVFGMENLKDLFGIDYRFKNDMEYNGDINLSKAAIMYSDKFTTVSESYCDNLKEPYCSRGLHHVIIRNEHKLSGIINGVDYDFYHPSIDKALYKNYSIDTLEDKVMNKKIWQDELGLPVDGDTPMLAIVSRLVSLKGLGIVTKIMEDVLQQDIQLVVVGTGDQKYVDYFKYLEDKYPTKVRALVDKYSNDLARKAYAASDIFIMPSKVEPCGISQMIASIYGSVPIVRETGGLKDTIKDFGCVGGGNGYTFASYNQNDLLFQINRAIKDYADKENWREKMRTCMSVDFSWDKPVKKYLDLYKSLID